jgi:hypothetical protein
MFSIKRTISELGWDGWTLLLCGVGAIVIAFLDFTQLITLSIENALRLVIAAVGLIMGAIVAQMSRRTTELRELREAVGITSVELLSGQRDFRLHAKQNIAKAKKFVLDVSLTAERATIIHPADDVHSYYQTIFERLQRKEISYRRVEVIFNKERFEYLIFRLLVYEGMDYFIRYYDPPPKPISVLNIMSVDNEGFYVGRFYTSDAPVDTWSLMFIRNPQIGSLFEAYWNNLWFSAKPLNDQNLGQNSGNELA